MNLTLPATLSNYIQAANARDHEALLKLFTANATVDDEAQTHRGKEEIRAWSERTAEEYASQLEPLALSGEATDPELLCRVSGTFDGSPIELRFHFALEADRIRSLAIRS